MTTPIVTVISDSDFLLTARQRTGSGIVPQSLDKLPSLEPGQSLLIEFPTHAEARRVKPTFYVTAGRRKMRIRLKLSDRTIQIALRHPTSVIS